MARAVILRSKCAGPNGIFVVVTVEGVCLRCCWLMRTINAPSPADGHEHISWLAASEVNPNPSSQCHATSNSLQPSKQPQQPSLSSPPPCQPVPSTEVSGTTTTTACHQRRKAGRGQVRRAGSRAGCLVSKEMRGRSSSCCIRVCAPKCD